MLNSHSIQAVAAFFVSALGLITAVVGVSLPSAGILSLGCLGFGVSFYLGLIHTAKSFVLMKFEKEEEAKSWKLKPY